MFEHAHLEGGEGEGVKTLRGEAHSHETLVALALGLECVFPEAGHDLRINGG